MPLIFLTDTDGEIAVLDSDYLVVAMRDDDATFIQLSIPDTFIRVRDTPEEIYSIITGDEVVYYDL